MSTIEPFAANIGRYDDVVEHEGLRRGVILEGCAANQDTPMPTVLEEHKRMGQGTRTGLVVLLVHRSQPELKRVHLVKCAKTVMK